MRSAFNTFRRWSAVLSLTVLPQLASCSPQEVEKITPEPWAAKAPAEWPQIVLTNDTSFKGHTSLRGASAFLVQTQGGEILAATARHLLGENGGVEPQVTLQDLDHALQSWILFPRTLPDRRATVAGLASPNGGGRNNDWLLLHLASTKDLPASPLRLRATPVAVGETIHLIGVSYAEPEVAQKVYSGKVTQRAFGDRFRYDVNPPVDIRGFSGAPIVDDAGWVVGVMSVWFHPRMNGTLYLEAGGEDARSALGILNP